MRDDELVVRRLAVDSISKIAEAWLARSGAGRGGGQGQQQEEEYQAQEGLSVSRALAKQRVLEHLLPGFIRLVSDSFVQMRASVAEVTGRLQRLLTQSQSTHTEHPALVVPAAAGAGSSSGGQIIG
ncbi:hypothetical protein VYU27_005779 [Nannochloropsis oceanica]